MAKVILLSQFPLPYSKIGSWTTMYKNYLESDHKIDYIICEPPESRFKNVSYEIVESTFLMKVRRRILKYYRIGFIDALKKIISENNDEKFIIQLVDNFKIVPRINQMLKENGWRKNCYIQIFYHGFPPFIVAEKYDNFHESIDELVLLTNDSYKAHKLYYSVFPCKISILYNGIDTKKFHIADTATKDKLKSDSGYAGKKVFLWCSQNRPKKGLHLIIDVWKRVYPLHSDIVLLVVGANSNTAVQGVFFTGEVPNDDLPQYYRMADCYLFPTLCHEGFPLSLTEALNCGCYCIASNYGGVPEVLQYGKYGRIIENPNYVSEWEAAINNYLSGAEQPIHLSSPIYTVEDWIANMNVIINNAKTSLGI